MTSTGSYIGGKTMLVTGGTGTVGSTIVRRLLRTSAAAIRIYSRDEHKQFELRQELPADDRLRFLIGDTRDLERLRRACDGVNVVFHAAAMKHVLACEYNPFEAIQTNIMGGRNVIDAAINQGVQRILALSTDKAVNPINLYGATKRCAEKISCRPMPMRERKRLASTARVWKRCGQPRQRDSRIPGAVQEGPDHGH